MSSPPRCTVPAWGVHRPLITLSSVDFPAPFVPSSATVSPSPHREVDAEQHLHPPVGEVDARAPEQLVAAPRSARPSPSTAAATSVARLRSSASAAGIERATDPAAMAAARPRRAKASVQERRSATSCVATKPSSDPATLAVIVSASASRRTAGGTSARSTGRARSAPCRGPPHRPRGARGRRRRRRGPRPPRSRRRRRSFRSDATRRTPPSGASRRRRIDTTPAHATRTKTPSSRCCSATALSQRRPSRWCSASTSGSPSAPIAAAAPWIGRTDRTVVVRRNDSVSERPSTSASCADGSASAPRSGDEDDSSSPALAEARSMPTAGTMSEPRHVRSKASRAKAPPTRSSARVASAEASCAGRARSPMSAATIARPPTASGPAARPASSSAR